MCENLFPLQSLQNHHFLYSEQQNLPTYQCNSLFLVLNRILTGTLDRGHSGCYRHVFFVYLDPQAVYFYANEFAVSKSEKKKDQTASSLHLLQHIRLASLPFSRF